MALLIDSRSVLYVGPEPRRLRAQCEITIAGQNVTDKFDPFLVSVQIEDPEGGAASKATIELDDRYGRITMPEGSDPIDILLGWPDEGSFKSFSGTVSDIESYGQKKTGRMMKIEASGMDVFTSGKSTLRMNFGDGSQDIKLGDAIEKAAQAAGYSANVDPAIGNLTRKYVIANNESFSAFAQRIATETGGQVRFDGKTMTMGDAAGFNPALGSGGAILFAAGQNLLSWRIKPKAARPAWGNVGHVHFDPDQAKYIQGKLDSTGGGQTFANATGSFLGVFTRATKDHSDQQARSDATSSLRQRGTGWVVVDGEPRCVVNGGGTVKGVRPGVDGDYRIASITHLYSRSGFTTRCEINQPGSNFGSVDAFKKQ